MTLRGFICVLGTLTISSASSLFAQTFGEVTGRISDATGAAIPAVRISRANPSTNAIRETLSTDSGDYTFAAVPQGNYRIRVERPSFKSTGTSGVPVQVQQTVRLDFTLELGSVAESVKVSASALRLQSEKLSLGTVIENKGVTELPLNGRNCLGLVALASNVKLNAYVEAPPGLFGNVGRKSIQGPGFIGFDAELHKQFRMPIASTTPGNSALRRSTR